jgi:hypothetical protein
VLAQSPFVMQSGFVGEVSAQIPWRDIVNSNSILTFKDVVITLVPRAEADPDLRMCSVRCMWRMQRLLPVALDLNRLAECGMFSARAPSSTSPIVEYERKIDICLTRVM